MDSKKWFTAVNYVCSTADFLHNRPEIVPTWRGFRQKCRNTNQRGRLRDVEELYRKEDALIYEINLSLFGFLNALTERQYKKAQDIEDAIDVKICCVWEVRVKILNLWRDLLKREQKENC